MNFNREQLTERLRLMPMVRAVVPLAIGIALAELVMMPLWLSIATFALAAAAALLFASGRSLCIALMLAMFGAVVADVQRFESPPPYDVRMALRFEVESSRRVRLVAWRDEVSGEWQSSSVELWMYADSTLQINAGESIAALATIRRFSPDYPSFRDLMLNRNCAGRIYLARKNILSRSEGGAYTLVRRLHTAAVERLDRLPLSPQSLSVAGAMALGDREAMTSELRGDYSRSGTAHLLAVSGLHVGIIFMIVNALLWWMPVVRFGHVWRNLLSIALIWLYAMTVGMSPSVVRAAVMFSFLQLSLAATSRYVSMNALAASAFLMLTLNAHYLFDISFQLSVIAVAGILLWGVPLYAFVRGRHRALNALWAVLAVGVASSVSTAPMVSHSFGYVSVVGLAVNPIAVAIAYVSVAATILWVVFPVSFAAPAMAWVVESAVTMQNSVIHLAASLPSAAVDYRLSAVATAVIYAIFVAATVAMWGVERKKSVPLPKLQSESLPKSR